ncbi:MAG: NUDIX domain-containing protein [Caldithrix sp.]|nr:NUDIX domain-containing protein [Caldithrix sp.]
MIAPQSGSKTYAQAAAIPYREYNDKLQILLITSQSGQKWIIPKGLVEDDLTAKESAAMEAFEEAGVKGTIQSKVWGRYSYAKWDGVCHVAVYALKVEQEFEQYPEKELRERQWMPAEEAVKQVQPQPLQEILKRFVEAYSDE